MRAGLIIIGIAGVVAMAPAARAEDVVTASEVPVAPCDGCVFVPAKAKGRPLVVVMHGDNQRATKMAAAFAGIAADRDLALFAPQCPLEAGCESEAFWRWNGDPEWIGKLVDDVVKRNELDPDRVWIIGWSGGATYLGHHLVQLGTRYAAIGFLGGGIAGPGGCPKQKLPVYIVAGDKSPYFTMVRGLRNHLEDCKLPVTWKQLAKLDHDDEWQAYRKPAMQKLVFDFLEAHPRPGRQDH
jgi:poly(3-hydroxybutyrate) depolymerase